MQQLDNQAKYNTISVAADKLVCTGPGVLHTIVQAQADAMPTAGSVIVYDNTTNAGRILYRVYWPAAAFSPTSVILDIAFEKGIYVDFTTTGDVNLILTYKQFTYE
jgi:hypothetical protein